MNKQLIECVPNISEGRDTAKINAIAAVVETVEGVKLARSYALKMLIKKINENI